MSNFTIWLVEAINKHFPVPPHLIQLHADKLSIENYQEREYKEVKKLCPEFGELWAPKNKNLLDIGCGLGGKPLYYAESGAKNITALDIRPKSTQATQTLSQQKGCSQILPINGDAARMPFKDNCFDAIVSINVFEHIDELEKALSEAKRVLKPNGLIFLHFPPFYSPWGAHLEGWINFPWPHLFFSDNTLIAAAQRIDAGQRNNLNYIPSAQVNWPTLHRLPDLNRVTAHKFIKMIESTGLHSVKADMLPFGRHYLRNRGPLARGLLKLLLFLTTLPIFREIITTKMVFVLKKVSHDEIL